MAELNIYGEIGGFTDDAISATEFSGMTADIDPKDDLTVYLNSPGGSVFDGLTIYQSLVARPGKNRIIVQGVAASIASVVAMAGDVITMSQSSRIMIHNPMGPSAMAFGSSDDLRDAAEDTLKTAELLDSIRDTLVDIYASRTGSAREQLKNWMSDETWMTAAEAKKNGFADKVSKNKRLAANAIAQPISYAVERDDLEDLARLAASVSLRVEQGSGSRGALELAKAKLRLLAQS